MTDAQPSALPSDLPAPDQAQPADLGRAREQIAILKRRAERAAALCVKVSEDCSALDLWIKQAERTLASAKRSSRRSAPRPVSEPAAAVAP